MTAPAADAAFTAEVAFELHRTMETVPDEEGPGGETVQHTVEPGVETVPHTEEPGVETVQHTVEPGVETVPHTEEPGVETAQHTVEPGVETAHHTEESGVETVQHTETPGCFQGYDLDDMPPGQATPGSHDLFEQPSQQLSTVPRSALLAPNWHMAASLAEQLKDAEKTAICVKCRMPITQLLRAKVWGKQSSLQKFICHTCNCVTTMVYKHLSVAQLDESGLGFVEMSESDVASFYQEAAKAAEGGLKWQTIRDVMVKTFTDKRISQLKVAVAEEELPLSVWASRGYDTKMIELYGNKVAHPVFPDVYSVPIRCTTREEVYLAYCFNVLCL